MTDTLEFTKPAPDPTRPGREPRKCKRHEWTSDLYAIYDEDGLLVPTTHSCVRCGASRDETFTRRNRNNRGRGKRTSADLARYLGPNWQNVEGMGWPWDVQSPAARIQCKREQATMTPGRALSLIEAIPEGPYLRAAYYIEPNRRIASGVVWLRLEDWVNEYGWALPSGFVMVAGRTAMIRLPVETFREVVG